jgi:Family of unknown function (DUF5712)
MYITITAQKLSGVYHQSVADFVKYLEKENKEKAEELQEHFFNQFEDHIAPQQVINEIDHNTKKLKKVEPKFYSITVNPSSYELKRLQNNSEDLKKYTRALMQDYVKAFNREINNKSITIDDIKYFAKVEHSRTFKGTDKQVVENQPFATKILMLKNEIRKINRAEQTGNIQLLENQIKKLETSAPHKQDGKRIVQGMQKDGNQSHIHIIVSRKDASNSYSLSPGSKYKSSEVILNGKKVKRGFDRDTFFKKAEQTFDKTFGYKRNYVETYKARKEFIKNPKIYFAALLELPTSQRAVAFKLLSKTGVPITSIPTSKVQLALKALKKIKQTTEIAIRSSSIGI